MQLKQQKSLRILIFTVSLNNIKNNEIENSKKISSTAKNMLIKIKGKTLGSPCNFLHYCVI